MFFMFILKSGVTMNQRGKSFCRFFIFAILVIPSAIASADTVVAFPCGGPSFPSCSVDWVTCTCPADAPADCNQKCTQKNIVSMFQSGLTDLARLEGNALYAGDWYQYAMVADGSFQPKKDDKKLQTPVCSWVPVAIFDKTKDKPFCANERQPVPVTVATQMNSLGQNCGPFSMIHSNSSGFQKRQPHMKDFSGGGGGKSGAEASNLAGMRAVALAHYYNTLVKDVTSTQSITVSSAAAGCADAAGQLNQAIQNIKTNKNLSYLIQGCSKNPTFCPPQHHLQESLNHIKRGFIALGECVLLESTISTVRKFTSDEPAALDRIAKDCGDSKRADQVNANNCYQTSYAQKMTDQINAVWPQASVGCQ